jgi:predicted aspartyl protease
MIDNINIRAFTNEYLEVVNALETQVGISEAFNPNVQQGIVRPKIQIFNAIWDTGATNSVISENVIKELNLIPIGKEKVYHANGWTMMKTYLVNIILPNNVEFYSLTVTESLLTGADVLVGMDIISSGDFVITASQGKTKFSFQMPSTHDTDYVKEYKQKIHTPVIKSNETGRNAPCPCGSGKKYKHCCGKNH